MLENREIRENVLSWNESGRKSACFYGEKKRVLSLSRVAALSTQTASSSEGKTSRLKANRRRNVIKFIRRLKLKSMSYGTTEGLCNSASERV